MNARGGYRSFLRVLPLYAAAYSVLLCGLGAYSATSADDRFGINGVLMILAGFCVSMFCRMRRFRQNTMFGILVAMVAVLVFWVSLGVGTPLSDTFVASAAERPTGPGTMLAWFVVLYSFAMIADEVIVFSVVPSIALIGLMASENLNPEIVVYFIGLVLSAVFLLIYDNVLAHFPENEAGPLAPAGGRQKSSVVAGLRAPMLLSVWVMGLAICMGLVASLPMSMVGNSISEHTQQINVPAASEFAGEVLGAYANQVDLSGAPPRLTDRIVMKVRCAQPMYWRARVFDEYTGFSWTNEPRTRPMRRDVNGLWRTRGLRADPDLGEYRGRTPLRQVFHLMEPPLSGVLACAGEPISAFAEVPLAEDQNHCLRTMDGRGTRVYAVMSLVPSATPRELMSAGTDFPLTVYGNNTRTTSYGREARLAIAMKATAGKDTQYEKVVALESYLRTNYEYTLTPPRTPLGDDAVTFFLTKSKVGYCEAFASAMAVLCRELDIPARLVTGFAPGTPEIRSEGEPVWVVRERDLHAWTEVYFPGYGWIPFDATSSRMVQASWWTSFREDVLPFFAAANSRNVGPLLVLLAISGITVSLAKWYAVDPLRRSVWWKTHRIRLNSGALTPEARWDMRYARIHRRLKRQTGVKQPNQTPFEYASRARKALSKEAADALDALTHLYVRGAFQRGGPSPVEFASFTEGEMALRRALRANS